jgi:hypothetical protein
MIYGTSDNCTDNCVSNWSDDEEPAHDFEAPELKEGIP